MGNSERLLCQWKCARSIRAIRSDSINTGRPIDNWIIGSAGNCINSRSFSTFFVSNMISEIRRCCISTIDERSATCNVHTRYSFELRGQVQMNAKLASKNNTVASLELSNGWNRVKLLKENGHIVWRCRLVRSMTTAIILTQPTSIWKYMKANVRGANQSTNAHKWNRYENVCGCGGYCVAKIISKHNIHFCSIFFRSKASHPLCPCPFGAEYFSRNA